MNKQAYEVSVLEASAQRPEHIVTDEALHERCQYWQRLPMIAIDTEFQRVDTFYPIPGLIQIADDQCCYLVDPLSIKDFSPLVALFENRDVLKVIHAGSEDLELFNHTLGALPTPIFDTQLAAAFVGWGFTMGLQRMVEHALGIQLGKGETTSDWLKRPLRPEQEVYAALDVAYLPAICLQLKDQLTKLGRLSWFEEESLVALSQAIDTDPEGKEYYRRFSQMSGLQDHKLAALRDITMWREQQSRLRDVPRNRILRNQAIIAIVQRWPKTKHELSRLEDIKYRVVKEDGDVILGLLATSQTSAKENPVSAINRPLHVSWNKRLKRLKTIARDTAHRLGVAQEVLLKKKDLDALVRSGMDTGQYQLPSGLQGWRKAVIGDALLDQLNKFTNNG